MSRYVSKYQELYPGATILLMRSTFLSCAFASVGARAVTPVPPLMRRVLEPVDQTRTPKLLIHLFSNGGSSMLYYLYLEYAASASRLQQEDPILPPHVTIFDSAPSGFQYWRQVESIIPSIPGGLLARVAAAPFVHFLCLTMYIRYRILGMTAFSARWAMAHNDKAKVLEAARSYIYSEEDRVILWQDVEEHAAEAEMRGFQVLRRDKFEGSLHVLHSKMDPKRYWEVVKQTWESGVQKGLNIKSKL